MKLSEYVYKHHRAIDAQGRALYNRIADLEDRLAASQDQMVRRQVDIVGVALALKDKALDRACLIRDETPLDDPAFVEIAVKHVDAMEFSARMKRR